MTPADEAHFIALWQQGAGYGERTAALGIPAGTVSSRASRLQQQGKIVPQPRGGAYPRQQVQARTPADRPPSTLSRVTVHRLPSTLHRPRSTIFGPTSAPP
jgi:hypothetical protein